MRECAVGEAELKKRAGHPGVAGDDQERAHLVELPDATACSGAAAAAGSRRGSDQ